MVIPLKKILEQTLAVFFTIVFILFLFLFLGSCRSGTAVENINPGPDGTGETISFNQSTLELSDINGGDLYPGEALIAVISLINSGDTACNNITVKLLSGGLLITDPQYDPFLIEKLEPVRSKEVSIPLLVREGLTEDALASVQLSVSSEEAPEFLTVKQDLPVFGVRPYIRGKIPIIGLHAIEDDIEIPIELYTYHFNVLCRTLKSLGFETITFKDLLDHLDYGRALPEKSVIITSDDGFGDLYTNAL
ncbi:MAG: hypothetical protein MUP02_02980, partial [Actinobacteria bacterium]|nr:hypothetical protein [Actinomycetota bacterium]